MVVLGIAAAVPETAVAGEGHLGTVVEEGDLGIVVVAVPESVATMEADSGTASADVVVVVVVVLTQLLLRRV